MPRKPPTRGEPCPTCGQIHPKCLGHGKHSKKPCGQPPQRNQEVCHLHGGRSPQALVGAASRALEDEARMVVATRWQRNGDAPIVDPLAELARLAGEIVAWRDYLRDQTQGLDGILAYWVDREYVGADGEVLRSEAAEQLRAVVLAYERSQDRSAKVLADMVKLDIAGRLADIRESQAALVVAAVRTGVAMVALDPEVRKQILEKVADQLALIATPDIHVPQELAT